MDTKKPEPMVMDAASAEAVRAGRLSPMTAAIAAVMGGACGVDVQADVTLFGADGLLYGAYRNSPTGARRVPPIYLAATWRNVLPVDDNFLELGMGFDLADGTTVRLRLGVADAKHVAGAILDYIWHHEVRTQSHSASGIFNSAVSTPDVCDSRCPPTISPSASSGDA